MLFVAGEGEDEAVQMVDEVAGEEMEAEDSGGLDMKVAKIEGNIPDTKRTDTEQSRGYHYFLFFSLSLVIQFFFVVSR